QSGAFYRKGGCLQGAPVQAGNHENSRLAKEIAMKDTYGNGASERAAMNNRAAVSANGASTERSTPSAPPPPPTVK
ncbi:MAG: hypothetical protein LBF83_01160, partial [Spirochaetaceae bacterium]|nr:hypothetical protein [Spirochaetaceae bacterium]